MNASSFFFLRHRASCNTIISSHRPAFPRVPRRLRARTPLSSTPYIGAMAHAERAPLLGARVSVDDGREDDFDDVLVRRRRAIDGSDDDDDVSTSSAAPIDESKRWRKSSARRHAFALAACAVVVMSSAMMMSTTVAFVRAAADASRTVKVRSHRFGVAPRAREVLSVDALAAYPWLAETRTSRNAKGSEWDADDVTSLGQREDRRWNGGGATTRVFEEVEDPLASELTRNSHALDRARTVEDFVAMSVQVDDAHAVGREPLRNWVHKPSWYKEGEKRAESNLEFGDSAFSVCLYNLHRWSRPIGASTWAEDLSAVLDAKRGVRSAARENLLGRCVKEVLHTNGRNDDRCMEADVVVFRGDTMTKPVLSSLKSAHAVRLRHESGETATRTESSTSTSASRKRESSRLGREDVFLTKLPQKSRRDQVYVYVSTAAPAALQTGRDLRDQTFLSQVDYLATSNAAFDSMWRSPLPTAKFMISSYDAFLRPLHMRLPVIGFGDSAVACNDGHSVGARILRRISEKYPVESIGTCMRNRNNTRFYNLGLSATSTETIRLQLELSKYLFYFVAEEVDCPGHVSEKLWLPLLRGSIPVYFGTKTVDAFLPCPKKDCVLSVKDYDSVDDLIDRMREIASNPKLYASLTAWRHNVPSLWPEKFRDGVARASLDIQAVMCDIMRNGDDARRRGSVSNFASAVPHSAPWLLGTYPNKNMDMTALAEIERAGRVSDVYCLRQDHVRALGEIFAQDDPDVRESGRTPAIHPPERLYLRTCDDDTSACGRFVRADASSVGAPTHRPDADVDANPP